VLDTPGLDPHGGWRNDKWFYLRQRPSRSALEPTQPIPVGNAALPGKSGWGGAMKPRPRAEVMTQQYYIRLTSLCAFNFTRKIKIRTTCFATWSTISPTLFIPGENRKETVLNYRSACRHETKCAVLSRLFRCTQELLRESRTASSSFQSFRSPNLQLIDPHITERRSGCAAIWQCAGVSQSDNRRLILMRRE
jgi:hypothetical protein